MDLKSLKEKKAMLSESYEVENILSKSPFKFDTNHFSRQTNSKLDKLGDVCKVLKPSNIDLSTLFAINDALVDMEVRKFTKECQLKNIQSDIEKLKEENNLVLSLQNEVISIKKEVHTEKEADSENEATGSSLDNTELDQLRTCHTNINETSDEADTYPPLYDRLLAESETWHRLQAENKLLIQRLSSVPVKPGFEFTTSNLQKLLDERQEQLGELKNQVLTASVME